MPPKDDQDQAPQTQEKPPQTSEASATTDLSHLTDDEKRARETASMASTLLVSASDDLTGMTLDGRYFIEKVLGRGGIGVVYQARDHKLMGRPVVVKVLLERSLQNAWAVQKFKHEMEALTRVDKHPGIVGILDAGKLADEKPYIVMQCVEGVTLRKVLQPAGMKIERVARIIEEAASALGEAHDEGILHRDLKPENIMLQTLGGGREQVKIIDFGIAKVRDSLAAPSTIVAMPVGTVLYMSPEQLQSQTLTPASDIYALGLVAYEMLTGRRAFNPETPFQLLEMQRKGPQWRPQALRTDLPVEVEAVILKALAFEPQERYQQAREFGEALMNALAAASKKNDDNKGEDYKPIKKGRRVMLAVALSLVLLVVAVAGFVAWRAFTAAPDRAFNYWLVVQKRGGAQAGQSQTPATGAEKFENGDKFQINLVSRQPGYLYILNQGLSDAGTTKYTLLYPTPIRNGASAQIVAGEQIPTGWNVFGGQAGTEQFWIVCAAAPVPELEAARDLAFKNSGVVADAAQVESVRAFLAKASPPEITQDSEKHQTMVQGKGDALVNLVKLEHR